jgi:hypothetical protein
VTLLESRLRLKWSTPLKSLEGMTSLLVTLLKETFKVAHPSGTTG